MKLRRKKLCHFWATRYIHPEIWVCITMRIITFSNPHYKTATADSYRRFKMEIYLFRLSAYVSNARIVKLTTREGSSCAALQLEASRRRAKRSALFWPNLYCIYEQKLLFSSFWSELWHRHLIQRSRFLKRKQYFADQMFSAVSFSMYREKCAIFLLPGYLSSKCY